MAEKKSGVKATLAIVRPSVIATTFSGRSTKYLGLQRFNLLLAAAYLVQAVLMWVLGHNSARPVTLNYLAADPLQTAAQHHTVLTLASHHWFDAQIGALVVLALVLAAILYASFATLLRDRFERSMSSKMNDLRWLSAILVGGPMTLVVALLAGVSDAAVLVALLGCIIIGALGALAVEANQRLWPWGLFNSVSTLTAFAVAACYIIGGWLYGTTLPAYVYVALALAALGTLGVWVNLYLQICGRGRWADYRFAEVVYGIVALVAVSATAWVVFAGALA